MSTLIGDLLAEDLFDDVRQIVADVGLRPVRTFVVTEEWSGGEIDDGERTVSALELLPRPRIRAYGTRFRETVAGHREDADLVVEKISLDFTRDELEGRPWTSARRTIWRVGDGHTADDYTLVGLERHATSWTATLRRMRRPRRDL